MTGPLKLYEDRLSFVVVIKHGESAEVIMVACPSQAAKNSMLEALRRAEVEVHDHATEIGACRAALGRWPCDMLRNIEAGLLKEFN